MCGKEGGLLYSVCHMYCMGRVIVMEGLSKGKVGRLVEGIGGGKEVRIMISEIVQRQNH